jgi:uncharacterized protein YcbX
MEYSPVNRSFEPLVVTDLLVYPIKSLGGMSVSAALVGDRGFEHDRRWMLIEESNRFVTQREFPEMALLKASIANEILSVRDSRDGASIQIPLSSPSGSALQVNIWDDQCSALLVEGESTQWFSKRMGRPLRLVYMPDASNRLVDKDYANQGEITGFSDGFPILIIGQSSLDDLNCRLEKPVPMDRFRPNIVFSGGDAFEEDSFRVFRIGDVRLQAVKPCARCVLTTTDQETAQRSAEPLKTLAGFRKANNKIYFGQNLLAENRGWIRVNDQLIVEQKQDPLFQNNTQS